MEYSDRMLELSAHDARLICCSSVGVWLTGVCSGRAVCQENACSRELHVLRERGEAEAAGYRRSSSVA